jgi:hypothetical protein
MSASAIFAVPLRSASNLNGCGRVWACVGVCVCVCVCVCVRVCVCDLLIFGRSPLSAASSTYTHTHIHTHIHTHTQYRFIFGKSPLSAASRRPAIAHFSPACPARPASPAYPACLLDHDLDSEAGRSCEHQAFKSPSGWGMGQGSGGKVDPSLTDKRIAMSVSASMRKLLL